MIWKYVDDESMGTLLLFVRSLTSLVLKRHHAEARVVAREINRRLPDNPMHLDIAVNMSGKPERVIPAPRPGPRLHVDDRALRERNGATEQEGSSEDAVEEARVSHVQWVASRVADIADEILTHAQLRVEDRVDQLVDLRNRAEPVIDAAEAVAGAARRVEEIEEYIAALRRIAGNLDTPTDEEEDEGQDADPAGDCDA